MAKKPIAKPFNGNTWTAARKKSFVISALRAASSRWGPKQQCIKNARVRRGVYRCEECKELGPPTLKPLEGNKKRRNNICADHINPIVSPSTGFVDYNTWIDRWLVELDGFQALCWECHNTKTREERGVAKERKAKEKKNESS